MRLVSFTTDARSRVSAGIQTTNGVAETCRVAELAGILSETNTRLDSIRAVLALPPGDLAALAAAAESNRDALRSEGALHSLESIRLGPPIPDPEKIICLGLNYKDHAE